MKSNHPACKSGFSLIETVIAIGVLAVLLTGFMIVFAPAAEGIRKSINVQQADRLASTLEQELVTTRGVQELTDYKTGFGKAFTWIKESNEANNALVIYQYRGDLTRTPRADGTAQPLADITGKQPGKDYAVQTMLRRKSDPRFINEDLPAIEGSVYVVKCTQLVFNTAGELGPGTAGQIQDPKTPAGDVPNPDVYPEAVIAFSAEFFALPAKSKTYLEGTAFTNKFPTLKNPVFTRNLAVRR